MSLIVADRVKELTTTVSYDDFVLSGALIGYRSFASVCNPNDGFYYTAHAVGASGEQTGQWECGFGLLGVGGTLVRQRVVSSSSGGPVDFAAGAKHVFITAGSEQLAYVGEVGGAMTTLNTIYYVQKDGADTNPGTSDTPDGAFLTIGMALEEAMSRRVYEMSNDTLEITIMVADGTYVEDLFFHFRPHSPIVRILGSGISKTIIQGATQSFTVLPSGACFGKKLILQRLTVDCINGGFNIEGVDVDFSEVAFTASSGEHVLASKSTVRLSDPITIEGGATNHVFLNGWAKCYLEAEYTLVGTPAFSDAFVSVNRGSYLLLNGGSFTGAATGKTYISNTLSCIEAFGGTFPGNASGETTNGGQYIP